MCKRPAREIVKQVLCGLGMEPSLVKRYYRKRLGKKLNLQNPRTFNEKLQWLKLNYRPALLTRLADKFAVREYVRQRVGEPVLLADCLLANGALHLRGKRLESLHRPSVTPKHR